MLPWQPFLAFYIWSAHWHHLANTTEPSMCGGDAALCQITLTTCYIFLHTHARTHARAHAHTQVVRLCCTLIALGIKMIKLEAKDVLPSISRTQAEKCRFFVPGDLDLWPLTLTFKLVRMRDQSHIPCEFGANPFSGSRDILYWFVLFLFGFVVPRRRYSGSVRPVFFTYNFIHYFW